MKRSYWRIGEPMVWLTGAALSLTLLTAAVLMIVIMINGLGVFWPSDLVSARLKDGSVVLGELVKSEARHEQEGNRLQFKIGNRDLNGLDFRWIDEADIAGLSTPPDAISLERIEYGNFYGYLKQVDPGSLASDLSGTPLEGLRQMLTLVEELRQRVAVEATRLNEVSYQSERLRLKLLRLDYDGKGPNDPQVLNLTDERNRLQHEFNRILQSQNDLVGELRSATAEFSAGSGESKQIVIADIVRAWQPNSMSASSKVQFYLSKLKELIVGEPRESNTEGGLFPAIFGTIMLIFVMSLFSFPIGVIAAVYLREYAREGLLVRIVRIAVNNLAGIPSIVYGIFGLGFFIYGIGGSIDKLFFPERLPTPTFGTGGILWASLTLALLTVPVVIVATEEALSAIPREMREGSYALGSTKFQTLWRILLPMASPGIMTGLILSMARAAGEVAPLMITGVVKLAPALPIDGHFPFVHLDRKFMHLGFHIYDIGFQSPNVEAAKPMVFVTTLLLVLIVLLMSSVAIRLRNKMKKRYTFSTF
jgi:phosphate transport system permease protein